MKQYSRGGLTFDVRDEGPADGPVVILLHGFPELNIAWSPLSRRLVAQGYRCVAPNQRGYSPGARPARRWDYRLSELVEDVLALIDACGVQRVHLVGHDWGAVVAWGVAQRYPERLATLTTMSVPHPGAFLKSLLTSRQGLASWYMYFFQLPRIPEWYFMNRRGKFTAAGITRQRSGDGVALFDHATNAMAVPGTLTAALNWYRAIPLSDIRGATEKIVVPTLFIWGDEDVALRRRGAEQTQRYVTGEYRFVPLRGTAHWILDERLDVVAELLTEWLAEHPLSR